MARLLTLKSRLQGMPKAKVQPLPATTIVRKRGTTGINDRNAIRRRDCGLCQECKRQGLVTLGEEVDHIVPLHLGGSDADSNKELLCKTCHRFKTASEAKGRAG
jgi:5-methylcytosine-specific restriction protein A